MTLKQYFKLIKLVDNNSEGGVIHTNFDSFKKWEKMNLSDSGKKLRDVPNAGGNSVISEVLSFELLRTCFGAQLLKVNITILFTIFLKIAIK